MGSWGSEVGRPAMAPLSLSRDDRDQYMDEPIAWAYVLNLELIATTNQPLEEN